MRRSAPDHRRRPVRLHDRDYSRPGPYYVTVVTKDRECLFGRVERGRMELNEIGERVVESWKWLAEQFEYVDLDAFVVMPNHLHGLIRLKPIRTIGYGETESTNADRPSRAPSASGLDGSSVGKGGQLTKGGGLRKPLGQLIGAFKTVSTKRINALRDNPGDVIWQRGFHERVIRAGSELARVCQYIVENPINWSEDAENPAHEDEDNSAHLAAQFTAPCRGGSRTALRPRPRRFV